MLKPGYEPEWINFDSIGESHDAEKEFYSVVTFVRETQVSPFDTEAWVWTTVGSSALKNNPRQMSDRMEDGQ